MYRGELLGITRGVIFDSREEAEEYCEKVDGFAVAKIEWEE